MHGEPGILITPSYHVGVSYHGYGGSRRAVPSRQESQPLIPLILLLRGITTSKYPYSYFASFPSVTLFVTNPPFKPSSHGQYGGEQ